MSFATGGESPTAANIGKFLREADHNKTRFDDPSREGLFEQVTDQFKDTAVYGDAMSQPLQRPSGGVMFNGNIPSRILSELSGALGGDMTREQVGALYEKLLGGGRYAELRRFKESGKLTPELQEEMDRYTLEQIAGMDANFDEGIHELKAIQLAQLRRLKDKYGIYGSQTHPEDFLTRAGPELLADMGLLQDVEVMMQRGGHYFDYENNADDQEYRTLSNYYNNMYGSLFAYIGTDQNAMGGDFSPGSESLEFFGRMAAPKQAVESEAAVQALGGRGFTEKQQKAYEKRVRKRFGKGDLIKRLFGRFAKK